MTIEELRSYFNRVFSIEKEWPKTFEVDADTYANCCQAAFIRAEEDNLTLIFRSGRGDLSTRQIWVGPNNGLMFKGVELILNTRNDNWRK